MDTTSASLASQASQASVPFSPTRPAAAPIVPRLTMLAPAAMEVAQDALQLSNAVSSAGKGWFKSKAVWGGVIAIGAAVFGALTHQTVSVDTVAELSQDAVIIAGAVGGVMAIIGRLVAKTPLQ